MSVELRTFRPGEQILIREVLEAKVWTARPVTVLEDSDDQLVTYLAPGTLIDYPVAVEHGEKTFSMWLSGGWSLGKKEFIAPGMLRIALHGQPFEVFASVPEAGGVTSWLREPDAVAARRPAKVNIAAVGGQVITPRLGRNRTLPPA